MDFARCSQRSSDSQIVVQENRRRFLIKNPNAETITKLVVDGCLIDDARPRCDFAFEIGLPCYCVIYLELKGCDVPKAYNQLTATLGHFATHHTRSKKVCHVVSSRVPKAGPSVQQMKVKMKKNHGVILKVDSQQTEICITDSTYSK